MALLAAVALAGCDSGERIDVPIFDAGGTDAACEIISRVEIMGLTAPVLPYLDYGVSEDQDPDRITVIYNGNLVPEDPAHYGMRFYRVPECAGHAVFELLHTVSNELIGRAEWDVVDVLTTFTDWTSYLDQNGQMIHFPDVYLFAFGEPGSYSVADMHVKYGPSNFDKELWRFHIVNGLLNDSVTIRLYSGDLEQEAGEVTPDGNMETLLVTNMAPKSYTIVGDVDHVRWHEYGVVPTKAMALEIYLGASVDPGSLLVTVPQVIPLIVDVEAIGINYGTWVPYMSGSVMILLVRPNGFVDEMQYIFSCRDPLWALTQSRYPCREY
jgi:hypothetical protein